MCMRPFLYIFIATAGLWACATRPKPQATYHPDSDYYVARVSANPYTSKKLLPDPINGLGTTNDQNIRVTDIRLTEQYTILYMSFKIDRTRDWNVTSSEISIQPKARLMAVNRMKSFELVKAEGITMSPETMKVEPNQEIKFTLYFERLDKGIEDFNMFECADTAEQTCWNVRGMHIDNK